jgi:hypothetical protein
MTEVDRPHNRRPEPRPGTSLNFSGPIADAFPMLLTTVSLVPVAVALALALGLFMAWTAYLIFADHRLLAARTADAAAAPDPAPVVLVSAEPVVAIVAPVTTERSRSRPHYLVAAPDPVPETSLDDEPELCPVVVRSGSFCTVLGASGVTASGTEMVCSSEHGARPRWRRAARQFAHSA